MSAPWHTLGPEEVLKRLDSSPSGLDSDEAARRLIKFGPNLLKERPKPSPARRFLRQFTGAPS
jgi:magnesium-transporting ATPase (P-type)